MLKIWKKSCEPFRSYLLNSTANPAKFEWTWAGLAVLFSRQLPNGAHNFFHTFSICFINYFMRNPQTTFAPIFLTHISARIDGVSNVVRRLGQISTRRRFCLSSAKITRGEPLRPFSFPQALKACICIIAAAFLSIMKNRCWLGLVLVLNLALKRLF